MGFLMIHIVHQLRKASGTNAKLAILKSHSDNEEWQSLLVAMYDSSINYYVSAPKDLTFTDNDTSGMFLPLLQLSSRTVSGNRAKQLALECSKQYGEIFRLVLGRSLKCGVSVSTINKAYPGLVPVFKVMLAKNEPVTEFPVLASIKYDGVRVIARVENGIARLVTRNGKSLHIQSLITDLKNKPDGVYDGELVNGLGKQRDRIIITGAVNKVLKGTATDILDYTYHIFDYLTLAEWDSQICNTPYDLRLSERILKSFPGLYCKICAQEKLDSKEEVQKMFHYMISRDYEGLILRYPQDMHEWRRTPRMIKQKATRSCILVCTDIVEGTSKYEGMVGALVCEGIVDGLSVRVKVGTGLSDFDRDQPAHFYLKNKIDIIFNDIVRAVNAEYHSLFLPVFKRIASKIEI